VGLIPLKLHNHPSKLGVQDLLASPSVPTESHDLEDATSPIKSLARQFAGVFAKSTQQSQVMHSTGRSQKLVYIDAEKFLELVAHSKKTERDLCASAGISKEVFDRLVRHGGPVRLSTLTRITTALRVSVTSLVIQRRRQ
jgi:DNA-binding Xre family transcriptional regulator